MTTVIEEMAIPTMPGPQVSEVEMKMEMEMGAMLFLQKSTMTLFISTVQEPGRPVSRMDTIIMNTCLGPTTIQSNHVLSFTARAARAAAA